MAWYDDVIDWVSDNKDDIVKYGTAAVKVGTSVWDIYNASQQRDIANKATQPGGITDPFGDERPFYKQQLRSLYQDPSSLQNQPGYRFAQEQGEKAINRQAAKSGHFNDPNRLYNISKYNVGLAEQTYGSEADRLAKLAGAGIAPQASALQKLMAESQHQSETAGAGGTRIWDTVSGLFSDGSSSSSEGGTGGLTAAVVGMADTEFDLGIEETMGGAGGNIMSAIDRIAAGEDPGEVAKDEAIDYAKQEALDYAKSEGADLFEDATGLDVGQFGLGSQYDAARELGGGALDRATSLQDLGANADLGGLDTGYTPEGTTTGSSTEPGMLGNAGVMAGAAVGSVAGDYIASKYINPNLGGFGETPIAAMGGKVVGGIGGAALGGFATGATYAGTTYAAGTAAAAGAGAATVAGPLAIAAAAYVIGSGLYGVYQTGQKKEESRDSAMRTYGEWWGDVTQGGSRVQDPTGGNLGMGYDTVIDGHRFFVPEKFHQMQLNKNLYGTDPNFREHSTVQGNYGSYYNPQTGEWVEGEFGNQSLTGDSTHNWEMGAGTWSALEGRASAVDNAFGYGMMPSRFGSSYTDLQSAWTNRIDQAIGADALRDSMGDLQSGGENTSIEWERASDAQLAYAGMKLNPDYGDTSGEESVGNQYIQTNQKDVP